MWQHQTSRMKGSLGWGGEWRAGGENWLRRLTAGTQGNPALVGPPTPTPQWATEPLSLQGAQMRGSGLSWLQGWLQPMQKGVSSVHFPTRLSWKKSNRSAPSQKGALQGMPRSGAQSIQTSEGGCAPIPQGLSLAAP